MNELESFALILAFEESIKSDHSKTKTGDASVSCKGNLLSQVHGVTNMGENEWLK